MKNTKIFLITLILLTISYAGGIYVYSTMSEFSPEDYLMFGGFGLLAIIGFLIGLKKYKDESKGRITEDELSTPIKEKAASRAFMYSMFWWTMIMLFTMDTNLSNESIIGIGIMGMGLMFIGFWFYYNNQGVGIENTH